MFQDGIGHKACRRNGSMVLEVRHGTFIFQSRLPSRRVSL
jgi:hypothetical protein